MKNLFKNSEKGSALVAVFLFAIALSLVIGVMLSLGVAEKKVNERHYALVHSQNAVESLLDMAVAQLAARWQNQQNIASNDLSSSQNPVIILSNVSSLYSGTTIDGSSLKVFGTTIPAAVSSFIDPNDPANANDPNKGQTINIQNVLLYAKASAKVPGSNDLVTAYGKKIIQIRQMRVTQYGVFYNMLMEIQKGSNPWIKDDYYGSVHSNGDVWVSNQIEIYFHDKVTIAGDYRRGTLADPTTTGNQDTYFSSGGGAYQTDYKGSGARNNPENYYTSLDSNWATLDVSRWNGNLLTQANGITPINPTQYFPLYDGSDPQKNYPYGLIEPSLSSSNPDYKGLAETEKYARKAGLIVRLNKIASGFAPDPAQGQYKVSNNYYVTFSKIQRTDSSNPTSDPVIGSNGNVQEVSVKMDPTYVSNLVKMNEYAEDAKGNPISGLYDLRRDKPVNTLTVDISQLRTSVDNTASGYKPSLFTAGYNPSSDYNGVVYVEFPYNTGASGRTDKLKISNDNLGLVLTNGSVVPNPTYNSDLGSGPGYPGFTVATNNTLYTIGNFNADGNMKTGSETQPDNPASPEPVVSLIADSITVLSSAWDSSKSKGNVTSRPAVDTEMNAAIITGIVPSNPSNSIFSGGVDNIVRLLEKWTGDTLRIRGAMANLFNSEIAKQPYNTFYFDEPKREWGLYYLFQTIPPAGVFSFKTFNSEYFRFITKAEYDAAAASVP